LQALKANGVVLPGLDGKIDGQLKVLFPLADNIQASEVRTEGRVRLTELRARNFAANTDLSGGTVNIDVSDKAVDVKGDLLVKGVTAKLNWQYIVNQPAHQQPPIRLVAVLDTADRSALGMDIADLVLGEVPVEVTLGWSDTNQLQTRVRADLTKAELNFEPIAWKKPPGQSAMFQFDPARGPGTGAAQRLELQQVKIAGDNIAVEGWMAIGPDNKLREFSFPEFTVNVVSRLNVQGKRRPDNVWDVTAKGATFDGRDMFRALFNVGQATTALTRKDKTGLDLTAEIETVLGFSDTNLRAVRIKASRREDKLTDLDLKATLPSGKPFAALVRNTATVGRQLLAEGADAGQVFKLVGFYPNATGGLMQLEVNLDAKGPNEKSGTLWARDFSVLGDPVVSEVFQTVDSTGPSAGTPKPRQKVVRQQFDFDGLSIPFDVGSGQFVMNGAAIRGPVIGATFRGKIDFKTQQLNLGGTYVPLSGLNSALGGILGPLSGGPQGEGLFGITFAVQGPLASPQVIVNPLSLLGPGIFREIFQITPEKFKINPRQDGPTVTGPGKARSNAATGADKAAARASSAPAVEKPVMAAPARGQAEVLSDWSSEVKAPAKKTP
jgi:AsmA-like C-terminal region